MVNGNSQADQLDRDLFKKGKSGFVKGNHVATVVTYEMNGTYNVQRFTGQFVDSTLGKGLGDLNHDGQFAPNDISNSAGCFEQLLYSHNTQFDAAGDLNGDGKIDSKDLFLLKTTYQAGGASQATLTEVRAAILRRGDLNHDGQTNATDIDFLSRRLNQPYTWDNDLDSNGVVDHDDAETLTHSIFNVPDGDANLDGKVDFLDLVALAQHYNAADGNQSWAGGDFTHDGNIDFNDLVELAQNYNSTTPPDFGALPAEFAQAFTNAPEPSSIAILALFSLGLARRRR
jgi:hypothetical protein